MRTSPAGFSGPAAHCPPACAAARRARGRRSTPARSGAGRASTRTNRARKRASSSCGGNSNHCGSILPCTLQRSHCARSVSIRSCRQSIPRHCRSMSRSAAQCVGPGIARIVDQRRLRAARAKLLHHRGQRRRRQLRKPIGWERTRRRVKDRHAVGTGLRLQRHVGGQQVAQPLGEPRVKSVVEPGEAVAREALVRAGRRIGVERKRTADEADQRSSRRAIGRAAARSPRPGTTSGLARAGAAAQPRQIRACSAGASRASARARSAGPCPWPRAETADRRTGSRHRSRSPRSARA